jgi:RND superfamily putative drug exporter
MKLIGDANRWLPRWLDRILPSIDIEGGVESTEIQPGELRAA